MLNEPNVSATTPEPGREHGTIVVAPQAVTPKLGAMDVSNGADMSSLRYKNRLLRELIRGASLDNRFVDVDRFGSLLACSYGFTVVIEKARLASGNSASLPHGIEARTDKFSFLPTIRLLSLRP